MQKYYPEPAELGTRRVVDGVTFVLEEFPYNFGPEVQWSAGPLGLVLPSPKWRSGRYCVNNTSFSTFENAARRSIQQRRSEYFAAVRLVTDYQACLCSEHDEPLSPEGRCRVCGLGRNV